jgi:hypothetical protein
VSGRTTWNRFYESVWATIYWQNLTGKGRTEGFVWRFIDICNLDKHCPNYCSVGVLEILSLILEFKNYMVTVVAALLKMWNDSISSTVPAGADHFGEVEQDSVDEDVEVDVPPEAVTMNNYDKEILH